MTKPADKIRANSNLTAAIAAAIVDALTAGLAPADVAAVLTRAAELLESED
jgi:hypothetical protein